MRLPAASRSDRVSRGFTLVEIVIVLVIIGLVAAGVLVGRDLIHAAEIQRTIADIETLQKAILTFRLKYNCVPGDCSRATNFGLGANGNGNGYIEPINWGGQEPFMVMAHLSSAGLIGHYAPGQWYHTPLGASTGIAYAGYFNWLKPATFQLGKLTDNSNLIDPSITPTDAYSVDRKIDNGLPSSGTVLGVGGGSISSFAGGDTGTPGNPGCAVAQGVWFYNTTYSGAACVVVIVPPSPL